MSQRHLAREEKRLAMVKRGKEKRDKLRTAQIDPKLSDEERLAIRLKLNAMPRDTSPSRRRRRCAATGVSRSVDRKTGLNRISFRNMALFGQLPGVTKSSW